MKHRVLVTGGAGRFGRLIVPLLMKDYEVFILDRDTRRVHDVFGDRVHALGLDLRNCSDAELASALHGVQCVVHLAGLVDYNAPERDHMEINFLVTQRLVKTAELAGVHKFLFVSSTSVFRKPRYLPVDEKHPFAPSNAYGRSKLFAEFAVKKSKLEFVIVRPCLLYGPGFEEGFKDIARWIEKGTLRIIGTGNNTIGLVYCDDAARAIAAAVDYLLHHEHVREEFIVSGESVTQKQAFAEVAKALRVAPPSKHVSKWLAYFMAHMTQIQAAILRRKPRMRVEHVQTLAEDRYYDSSKARKLLGWKPRVPFAKGVKAFVRSLKPQEKA